MFDDANKAVTKMLLLFLYFGLLEEFQLTDELVYDCCLVLFFVYRNNFYVN
jgi:hypothetical protein